MDRYGLPRLTLQRNLNRMARESMIERKPGRGWVFRPLLRDIESHRQSYRFRMALEPTAILEPGYQVDLEELEKCRREQTELLAGGIERCTPAELYRTGVHFHETVIAGAHNPFFWKPCDHQSDAPIVEYAQARPITPSPAMRGHLVLIDLL